MKDTIILDDNNYCTVCHEKGIPIQRLKSRQKSLGHLKKLYCLKCGKETNHARKECITNMLQNEINNLVYSITTKLEKEVITEHNKNKFIEEINKLEIAKLKLKQIKEK